MAYFSRRIFLLSFAYAGMLTKRDTSLSKCPFAFGWGAGPNETAPRAWFMRVVVLKMRGSWSSSETL